MSTFLKTYNDRTHEYAWANVYSSQGDLALTFGPMVWAADLLDVLRWCHSIDVQCTAISFEYVAFHFVQCFILHFFTDRLDRYASYFTLSCAWLNLQPKLIGEVKEVNSFCQQAADTVPIPASVEVTPSSPGPPRNTLRTVTGSSRFLRDDRVFCIFTVKIIYPIKLLPSPQLLNIDRLMTGWTL